LALACCACATNIRPDVTGNPPPAEPLSDFQDFQLQPLTSATRAAHETGAINEISTYMQQRVGATLAGRDDRNRNGRTREVEPRIEKLKFVGGGARFWVGAFAGSSAVLMKMKLVDAQTGRVIADPEFYQRARAMGGAWTFSGTDHGMLARIATVARQYLQRNDAQAVGGPTGLDGSEDK
jgi:hypothetical protein